MKEFEADLLFEDLMNYRSNINLMLNKPLFKIKVTENINNENVQIIVDQMIDIANADFVSMKDSGIIDLLLLLDDEIHLIYNNMRDIMLRKYKIGITQ